MTDVVEMADVSRVGVSGPLGPFVAWFVTELSRQGFQPVTVGKQVGLFAGVSAQVGRGAAGEQAGLRGSG